MAVAAVAAVCAVIVGLDLLGAAQVGMVDDSAYVPELRGATGAANVLASQGDGQGFALLARDPLLRTVGAAGAEVTAYRASRPATSYLAWLAAAGRPELVAWGLVTAAVVSAALAAYAVGRLAMSHGMEGLAGLIVLLSPGAIASLPNGGAELLALAGAAGGLALWPRRPWLAAAAFTFAGLCRETALLVPLALILHALWSRRRVPPQLLVPAAAWFAWASIVRVRYEAWPWEWAAGADGLGWGLPAILEGSTLGTVANVTLAVAHALLAIVVLRRGGAWAWVVATIMLFAGAMGPAVWSSYLDFGRVLLPLWVLGLLELIRRDREPSEWVADPRLSVGFP